MEPMTTPKGTASDIPAKTTQQAEAGYLKIKGKDTIGRDIPDWRNATVYHATSKDGYKDISKNGYRILGEEADDGQGGYYGEAVSFTPTKSYAEQFGDKLTVAKLDNDVKILNLNDPKDWDTYRKITNGGNDLSRLREQVTRAGYDGVYDAGAGDLFLYRPEKAKLISSPNPSRPPEVGGRNTLKSLIPIAAGASLYSQRAAQAKKYQQMAEEQALQDAYSPVDMVIAGVTGGATMGLRAISALADPVINYAIDKMLGD